MIILIKIDNSKTQLNIVTTHAAVVGLGEGIFLFDAFEQLNLIMVFFFIPSKQ